MPPATCSIQQRHLLYWQRLTGYRITDIWQGVPMSILPAAYPQQKPIYLRSGDLIVLPEHSKYVNLREYLLTHTVAVNSRIAQRQLAARNSRVRVRSISEHPYNCVGLIFANRRAWIDMDSDHIENYLELDGYRQVSLHELSVGDVVLYANQDGFSHIGMVIQAEIEDLANISVLSKWGFAGEFIHHLHDVPSAYGIASHYWSERRPDVPE